MASCPSPNEAIRLKRLYITYNLIVILTEPYLGSRLSCLVVR